MTPISSHLESVLAAVAEDRAEIRRESATILPFPHHRVRPPSEMTAEGALNRIREIFARLEER